MTGNNTFATDIFCVRQIGLTKWLKDFHWPVSSELFREINDVIIQSVESLYSQLSDDELDIVLSDGFIFIINQFAHASIVNQYCKKNNYQLLIGKSSKDYFDPNWDALAHSHHVLMEGSSLKFLLRSLAKNFVFNASVPTLKKNSGFFNWNTVGLGSNSWLKQEYIKNNDVFVHNTFLPLLLKGFEDRHRSSLAKRFHSLLEAFVENICFRLAQQFHAVLDAKIFLRCWVERLSLLNSIYNYLLSNRNHADTLLVTEPTKPMHKIIASSWRRQGKKTVGFHHGHFMGEMYLPSNIYNEQPVYTDFVLPGTSCAHSYMENYKKTVISEKRQTCFSSVKTDYYLNLWSQMQKNSSTEKISKVMIMGYPMDAHRYLHLPGCFFAFQLDLEIRLIQFLQNNNFEVYYKIHPERMDPLHDILKDLKVNIVSKPFEETWNLADALLVKYSASTTFAFALCTNKPIFMLDYEKTLWNPSFYKSLAKRCIMIPSCFNEKNRIEFDSDYLLKKLSEKHGIPDYEYLKSYIFPEHTVLVEKTAQRLAR